MPTSPLCRKTAGLLVALVLVTSGCRTVASPPAPKEPLPVPPPPAATAPSPPSQPPPAAPKVRAYRPVPEGLFESTARFPESEVTEWRMTNGARLVFRPSRAAPRSVTLHAFAPGGFLAVPDSLAGAALMVARAGGSGHPEAAVQPALREREALLLGTASSDALVMLFETIRDRLERPGSTADLSVQEGLDAALAGLPLDEGLRDPASEETLYNRLFGDLRRYTFVLVGDTTPEAIEAAAAEVLPRIRPSLQALLGSDDASPTPRVPMRAERLRLQPKGAPAAAGAFRGSVDPGFDTLAGLDVLAAMLEDAFRGSRARASAEVFFDAGVGEIRVVAEGDDIDLDDFERELLGAVQALRSGPPSVRALTEARVRRREAYEAAMSRGSGWLPWLVRLYRYDQDTREALRYPQRLDAVTADEVRALARAVLDPEHSVLVVRPER